MNLVKHSDRVGVLPRKVVEAHGSELSVMPVDLGQRLSPYGIVSRKGVELTPAVLEMTAILLELAATKQA